MSAAITTKRQRMLIVKFGAIGDCVMAIPGAYAAHLAGYEVHWVCGQAVAPVLALYPWLQVQVVDDGRLLRGSLRERVSAMVTLWKRIGFGRWDVCATLYYDRRYALLTLPVRAARKFQLSHTDRSRSLLDGRHHTDEYARILLGRKDDVLPAQLAPVPPPGELPTPLPRVSGRARIVLVAGGARNMMRDDALRRWPVEQYVAVARELLARGHEVVLSGGPDDVWTSPSFAGLGVTDMTGKLSLVETVALLGSADVTVTHDTGPLHLAGLTASSIVAIFGPTNPRGRLPQRAGCVALWGGEGFACRPCYDGRDYAPCSRNLCVEQVTPKMLVSEVEALLEARAQGALRPPVVRMPRHTAVSHAEELVALMAAEGRA